jgi:hypothetical protein
VPGELWLSSTEKRHSDGFADLASQLRVVAAEVFDSDSGRVAKKWIENHICSHAEGKGGQRLETNIGS